ncbi:MAG: hypothetical protein II523_03960, partial [Bacteroidales bacterium]|nr:hypothetical protein [Bacteroidales bacterium]
GGYGYGYGDGDGYGIKEFDGSKLYTIDSTPTAITAVHGSYAEGFTIRHNSQKVLCYIARVGDFFAHGATLKDARRDAQQKFDDNLPTEEKIRRFLAFCAGKDYIPAADLFQWHHTLTGSCEMGRREFCKVHNIDIDNDQFTIYEFINLTIDSFGGNIIKQLKNFIMRTDDIKKLVKAGYTVYRAQDYPSYMILKFNNDSWDLLCQFFEKENRDEALENLLRDDKNILD